MHVRKLVKSGHASLVTALPTDFIRRHNLKQGDVIYIHDKGKSLELSAEQTGEREQKTETVINVDGKDNRTLLFDITSAYINNFDLIRFKGKDITTKHKSIKEKIGDLVALEVVDENSSKIVARDFLNLHDIDVRSIVRRMDNIVRSMMTDIHQTSKGENLADYIQSRDNEINKLNFFVLKILKAAYLDTRIMESLGLEHIELLRYWEINHYIEKIGDDVKALAPLLIQEPKKHASINLYKKIEALYGDAMKAFYTYSIQRADDVGSRRKDLLKSVGRYLERSDSLICTRVMMVYDNMIDIINNISKSIRILE